MFVDLGVGCPGCGEPRASSGGSSRMIGLVRRTAAVAAACVACLTFTAGTAPNAGAASSLCKDYKALAHVRGTRVSDLRAAEALYRKLAAEAPAKAKAD